MIAGNMIARKLIAGNMIVRKTIARHTVLMRKGGINPLPLYFQTVFTKCSTIT